MNSPVDTVFNDFSSPAAMSNFRINADGTLNKRDGYYMLRDFGESVRGAYTIEDITYTVIGNSFWKLQNYEFTLIGEMTECSFEDDDEKVSMFCNADILYIIGGGEFYYYNILEEVFSVYQTYVPLIYRNTSPSGVGEYNESANAISNHKKIEYTITHSDEDYYFPESVESIVSVAIGDEILPDFYYTLESNGTKNYIHFPIPDILTDVTSIVIEFVSSAESANLKKQYLSNTNAFLYSDEEESRLFLYGKNTNGKIMFAKDRNNDSSPLNPCLDYIPTSSYFNLIDGNRDIHNIVRYNDTILAITSNGTHQIQKRSATNTTFYSKMICPDFYTTEKSGIVITDEVCYSFSNDGLLALSYIEQDEKYAVKKIEISEYMRPNRELFSEITLHFNKILDELWCCYNDNIAVYNIRRNLWYKFTDITADLMFIYNSQTAFSLNGAVYLFDEDAYTDNNIGFDAVYESGIHDLGNIFKKKTIFGFGAVINNIYGATLVCTLKSDKDAECNITISANERKNVSKYVQRVHARLGHCFYVTLRLVSPAASPPAHIKGIMLRYR